MEIYITLAKYTKLELYEYLFNLGTKNITFLNNKNIYKNLKKKN